MGDVLEARQNFGVDELVEETALFLLFGALLALFVFLVLFGLFALVTVSSG